MTPNEEYTIKLDEISFARMQNTQFIKLVPTDYQFYAYSYCLVVSQILEVKSLITALERLLIYYPPLVGRIIRENNSEYYIDLSTNGGITLQIFDDHVTERFEEQSVLVSNLYRWVPSKAFSNPVNTDTPLLSLFATRIHRSNEFVLGFSWMHCLVDAASMFHLTKLFSEFYCDPKIMPTSLSSFSRFIPPKPDGPPDPYIVPLLSYNLSAVKHRHRIEHFISMIYHTFWATQPLTIKISSAEILSLKQRCRTDLLTSNISISSTTAITAYVIQTLNSHLPSSERIERVVHTVNYRAVAGLPPEYIGNAVGSLRSETFFKTKCAMPTLSSVAKTIHETIMPIREEVAFREHLLHAQYTYLRTIPESHIPSALPDRNELTINSWPFAFTEARFGTQKARFFTQGALPFCLRIVRTNGDEGGFEAWLGVPKKYAAVLGERFEYDVRTNFEDVL